VPVSPAPEPVTWTTWVAEPALVWCAAAAAVYEAGRRRRHARPGSGPGAGKVAAFWAGLAVVVVALASPLDPLAGQLFAAHMAQHLLLAQAAPLLLVAAAPARTMSWVLARPTRHVVMRAGHRVGTVTGLGRGAPAAGLAVVAAHALALAAWHLPAAYDLAVAHPVVHAVEHLSLFATGLAFWWLVVGVRGRTGAGLALLYLFVVGLAMGGVAALLTLAPRPLYTSHLLTTDAWGLTPLQDQQLAGAIMWVPGGLVYLGAAAVLVVRWLAAGPAPGERGLAWRS
jgi:putative membrane protein